MQIDSTPYLLYIYSNIDKVLLIFARVIGFIYLIPIFSGKNAPTRVKVGLSFIIAISLFSTGVVRDFYVPETAVSYVFMIAKEVLTGITISFIVYMFFTIFYFAGQMMDYSIGFSMVNVFDPIMQLQVPITGNIIYYAMAVMFIRTGGLNALIATFFNSYTVIPLGGANFAFGEGLTNYMVMLTSSYLSVGFRIAAPLVGTIMIIDVSLGILVKASPQMNVFVVGMPIKLMAGLVVLTLICPYFIDVYQEVYQMIIEGTENIIGALAPNP